MRKFDHPNLINFRCPVCRTSADAPVVLVPIERTESDGVVECNQVHADCYEVVMRMYGVNVVFED